MKSQLKTYVTAGVAIVGASVIAVTPITLQPQDIAIPNRTHEVSLLAADPPFEDGFSALVTYIDDLDAPVEPQNVPEDQRNLYLAAAFTASGMRLAEAFGSVPVGLFNVAAAYLQGAEEGDAALAQFIVDSVDGPLWVADPVLYGLRDTTDSPASEQILAFRNDIWQSTQDLNAFLLGQLDLDDPEQNPMATLAAQAAIPFGNFSDLVTYINGRQAPVPAETIPAAERVNFLVASFVASGVRLSTALALFPVGVANLFGTVLQGDTDATNQALSNFIADVVDAPLFVADPVLYGLRDTTDPESGGGAGGEIETFRNDIWQGTQDLNSSIQMALGLPEDVPTPPADSESSQQSLTGEGVEQRSLAEVSDDADNAQQSASESKKGSVLDSTGLSDLVQKNQDDVTTGDDVETTGGTAGKGAGAAEGSNGGLGAGVVDTKKDSLTNLNDSDASITGGDTADNAGAKDGKPGQPGKSAG